MMKHYLLTVELFDPCRIHSYVMTDDRRVLERVAEEMLQFAEQEKLQPLGIVLVTELSAGGGVPDPESIELVRKLLRKLDPRVEPTLAEATDFHRTTWLMAKDHESDGPLMELH